MGDEGRSSFGFEENVVGAASYIPVLGFFIMLKEEHSDYVRFHSLQSTLGYAVLFVYWLLVKFIGALYFLWWSPGLLSLAFGLFMLYKAYDGIEQQLPVIGKYAFEHVFETREDLLANAEAEQAAAGQNGKG